MLKLIDIKDIVTTDILCKMSTHYQSLMETFVCIHNSGTS